MENIFHPSTHQGLARPWDFTKVQAQSDQYSWQSSRPRHRLPEIVPFHEFFPGCENIMRDLYVMVKMSWLWKIPPGGFFRVVENTTLLFHDRIFMSWFMKYNPQEELGRGRSSPRNPKQPRGPFFIAHWQCLRMLCFSTMAPWQWQRADVICNSPLTEIATASPHIETNIKIKSWISYKNDERKTTQKKKQLLTNSNPKTHRVYSSITKNAELLCVHFHKMLGKVPKTLSQMIVCWWFAISYNPWIHPGKLTWNLKITCLKMKIIFQTFIFQFIANFQVCKSPTKTNPRDSMMFQTTKLTGLTRTKNLSAKSSSERRT